jgi:hypothetical protein
MAKIVIGFAKPSIVIDKNFTHWHQSVRKGIDRAFGVLWSSICFFQEYGARLNCRFIIAEQPYGVPVAERAIPTTIWKAEPAVMKFFLRKWLKSPGLDGDGFDIRNVLDWDYYMERLGKLFRKSLHFHRVAHPEWLNSKVQKLNDKYQQQSIVSMFGPVKKQKSVRHESCGNIALVPMDI